MAIKTITNNIQQEKGIDYSVITDTSADWSGVTNDTYFYNLDDRLPYYKNTSGDVIGVFEEGGSSISDGDKGDVTVSASGNVWTIDNDAVTFDKIQNVSTNRVLARSSSGVGSVEELTLPNFRALINVEDGATADQTPAEIKSAYESNTNTNAFTDAEKTKLSSLESSKFLGEYVSLSALQTAHPSPSAGSYANVDLGIGQNVKRYIWDDNDSIYVEQGGVSTALTDAQIKTQYENNADTNAFTDSEKAKLGVISVTQSVNLDAMESDIATNNAKVGITSQQASDIVTNNAKVSNATHTGDVTGSTVLTISNNAVTNDKLANMPQYTIKGSLTGIGSPINLTEGQVRSIINVEDGADVTDSTNVEAAGAVMETDTTTVNMQFVVDEDDMVSDSDTKVPTQQSVKAYVDGKIIDGAKLRVPTETEWTTERLNWSSNNSAGAFGSVLKLPMAGYRNNSNGSLYYVGTFGAYWSSTVSGTNARSLNFISSTANMPTNRRALGRSVRLIVDGTFTQAEFNNDYLGKTIEYLGLTYGFVYNSTTQKVWLDRNLGATQVATSSTDSNAYGDLYQWGRPFDGHQSRTSLTHDGDTLGKPSTQYESGAWDGKFITTNTSPNDWLNPQDDNLWKDKNSFRNKTFTLESPTSSDDITIFRTDVDITVQEVIAVSVGTSPSTTYQLKHSTDRNAAGNALTTSAVTTSKTNGDTATLSDATIPANSWVWFETTAATGTNVRITIDIRYTID
jgi:hypothetical protein